MPTGEKDEAGEDKLIDKIFVAPAPKARMVRRAIEITENMDLHHMTTSDLDSLVDYVVSIYGKQFTIDDVYDGIDADNLIPTLMECLNGVVGKMGAKLEEFPNGQAGA